MTEMMMNWKRVNSVDNLRVDRYHVNNLYRSEKMKMITFKNGKIIVS